MNYSTMEPKELRESQPPYAGESFETGAGEYGPQGRLINAYQRIKWDIAHDERASWFEAVEAMAKAMADSSLLSDSYQWQWWMDHLASGRTNP